MSPDKIIEARGKVWAAAHRLESIVPPKWEESVPLCVKVERDQILSLLREALAIIPENPDEPKPAYIRTEQWA
jgi:hypothetical protein